ncbi:hypothetical protein F5B22DRAFT_609395 [Xylaria bambusicola]|uniref:uncharacterized protein n=1 Tax=Xylaria bambusicola TaxID=326684 RepID=UPI00200747A8|nr:uncharacterized protein F5B22DRAFT_609395 [Xylaria bambusicola]KAI0515018.1 hypothetical protein F5B22DRAFT_609395 [Xylaria bambusicola]
MRIKRAQLAVLGNSPFGMQTIPPTVMDKAIQRPHLGGSSKRMAILHPPILLSSIVLSSSSSPSLFLKFEQTTIMEANKTPYPDFDNSGLKYEFVTEMSADIWKISRKSDRMEYLAQNVTFMILRDDKGDRELTDYGHLLAPHGEDLIQQIKVVLNHPNLVNLVDSFAIDFSPAGSRSRKQWFLVWDYCDAGNLGNLFVPPQPRPQDRPSSLTVKEEDGNGDTEMKDMPLSTKAQEEHQMFLPESFCWHVLTSVLRALAWLHDGIRDVVVQDRHWERLGEDIDWSPMLHRNITPQNIFLGHPRRRESYGPVKLGNYGRLFVSGHCQIAGDKHEPTLSKAIGPHPSQDYTPLDELIALDMSLGNVYPWRLARSTLYYDQ